MALDKSEREIINRVFLQYSRRNFAKGVYETNNPPISYSTATTSASMSVPFTYTLKSHMVECTAEVAGLDYDLFSKAVEAFLEISRQKTFDILAKKD